MYLAVEGVEQAVLPGRDVPAALHVEWFQMGCMMRAAACEYWSAWYQSLPPNPRALQAHYPKHNNLGSRSWQS